jgi:hypothetical protein
MPPPPSATYEGLGQSIIEQTRCAMATGRQGP